MDIVDTKVEVQYENGGIRMEKIPNAVYTKEFREEAVRMVLGHNLSAYEVAQNLSIPKPTITCWVREAKKGRLSLVGNTKKALSEAEIELAKVKRELAQVKMKRDFLRKAAAYFAKEP
ncbi:MAG: Transposase [Syntrophorhabdus sp. PtaU1.Bin002]|nr:MAG: Transposase [Syntrophorhabdus sp. PtaB.Bin006]OPY68611.1 MAG: Transposase [Syntrophorhabdus sp. PtaU1.Bin002]